MDANITLAIPAGVLVLIGNLVVNFLRFNYTRKNGIEASMLTDIKEGQKGCAQCFKELGEASIKSEVHLGNIVQQLQTLNNNSRRE